MKTPEQIAPMDTTENEARAQWIPMTEARPETGRPVLLFIDDGSIITIGKLSLSTESSRYLIAFMEMRIGPKK